MSLVRKTFRKQGLSRDVIKIMLKGWRKGTRQQYTIYLNRWIKFCHAKGLNPTDYDISHCLEFLLSLFKKGYSYSALNAARSALSCLFTNPPIGNHPSVVRFLRGVFNSRPCVPRYCAIWDVSIVLRYLASCSPSRDLNLQMLTLKLVTLCALVTGHRSQTIHAFDLDSCEIKSTCAKFRVNSLLKHTTPSRGDNVITLPAFGEDKRLCVVTYLREYIKRSRPFRSSSQLFMSFISPHGPVSKDTISRWIKLTLKKAGIDTKIFKAHSTRAASTSAVQRDVDISVIMKSAGWTRKSTFARFYKKTIFGEEESAFGKAVLRKISQ